MLFKTWQRGSLKICIHGNNGHYIFKLSAHESVKVPAEVFFCNQVPYSASDAVKFNMADQVQFLHLAASEFC